MQQHTNTRSRESASTESAREIRHLPQTQHPKPNLPTLQQTPDKYHHPAPHAQITQPAKHPDVTNSNLKISTYHTHLHIYISQLTLSSHPSPWNLDVWRSNQQRSHLNEAVDHRVHRRAGCGMYKRSVRWALGWCCIGVIDLMR